MALQNVNGIWLPEIPNGLSIIQAGGTYNGSGLLDAVGEKFTYVFRTPKAGTLDTVGFLTGTVTTGDTLKVSFQDVSITDGIPDGTADQYRTVVINDTDDDIYKETGLITSDGTDGGVKRTVTQGELLSIVIEFNSYVAGNLTINGLGSAVRGVPYGQNYAALYTTLWTKLSGHVPGFVLKYSDGSYSYIDGVLFTTSVDGASAYNSGTTPDEKALIFQVPYKMKVGRAWCLADVDGDADLVLYDSDGSTVLTSVSIDKDIRAYGLMGGFTLRFPVDVALDINTDYYLSLKPTSVTNITLITFDVNSAAQLDQWSGGQNFRYAERTDAGAWTTTATRRPFMGVGLSALDDGVGGGGGGSLIGGGLII